MRLFDGQIHRGMVGNVEIEDLRGTDGQHMVQCACSFRQRIVEHALQRRLDARHMAKRGIDHGADEPAVLIGKRPIGWIAVLAVQHAIERDLAVDDGGEDLGRSGPGFQPRLCRRTGGNTLPFCFACFLSGRPAGGAVLFSHQDQGPLGVGYRPVPRPYPAPSGLCGWD